MTVTLLRLQDLIVGFELANNGSIVAGLRIVGRILILACVARLHVFKSCLLGRSLIGVRDCEFDALYLEIVVVLW